MRRSLVVVNYLLAGALVAMTAVWYAQLPPQIPIHFNGAGQPDGWSARGAFLLLPLVGLAVACLLAWVAKVAVRNPALINMPGKQRILALPPEERRQALEPVVVLLHFMNTMVLLIFMIICVSTYRSALGHDVSALLAAPLYCIVAAMLLAPVALLVVTRRRETELR